MTMTTIAAEQAAPGTGRLLWVDRLRVAAIASVVWLHVVTDVTLDPALPRATWWAANLTRAASAWGVDVFVLVAGLLALPRAGADAGDFYRRRAARLLPPLTFWTALYLARRLLGPAPYSAGGVAYSLLVARPYYHLWFLYMIAGLFLVAPSLAALSRWVGRRSLARVVGLGVALTTGHWAARTVTGATPDVFGLWVPFTPVFLAGPLLAQSPPRWSARAALALLVAGVLTVASLAGVVESVLPRRAWRMTPWIQVYHHLSPFVMAAAAGVFLLFRAGAGRPWPLDRAAERIAPYTLGVYAIHPLAIEALAAAGVGPSNLGPWLGVPLAAIGAFGLSLAAARAIAFAPGGRRLVT